MSSISSTLDNSINVLRVRAHDKLRCVQGNSCLSRAIYSWGILVRTASMVLQQVRPWCRPLTVFGSIDAFLLEQSVLLSVSQVACFPSACCSSVILYLIICPDLFITRAESTDYTSVRPHAARITGICVSTGSCRKIAVAWTCLHVRADISNLSVTRKASSIFCQKYFEDQRSLTLVPPYLRQKIDAASPKH